MSLVLGLLAALAWALHDICVRAVSQRAAILPSLLTVLVAGAIALVPLVALDGAWSAMTPPALALSGLSGLAFAAASLGLYGAFRIGPVRLVAPIIGAYPVVSVGWAALTGSPVSGLQWGALLVVMLGVALVAILSDSDRGNGNAGRAVLLALLSSGGFALTFAAGQAAVRAGAELPVTLFSRVVAASVVGAMMLLARQRWQVAPRTLPLLVLMGLLDASALASVMAAGTLPHPEFAAVAASLFGLLTVVLAWAVLKEPMRPAQWGAVVLVFCGIGYLGL
ncbi:DMT family transporter [Puniceibacterium confluentis]|uniref:DMT family transporter n=1 Tax=Puniceibacterium confluentis TaxID=1958944 RepID=UPI0011B49023|nr:DMT family transporter [Puniceibacterium confluentis]